MLKLKRTLLYLLAPLALFGAGPTYAALTPAPLVVVDDEDEDDEAEEEEEEDRWLAVVGGDVHTGTGAVLRGATLLAKNGVIEELGYDVWVPEEAERIDARGLRVYPGLIAVEAAPNIVLAQGRMVEDDLGHVHAGDTPIDPIHALEEWANELTEVRAAVEDSFDPFSRNLVLALSAGITTTVSGGTAVKLKRGEIDDLVMSEDTMVSFTWSSKNPSGKRTLREKFEAAGDYLRAYREWSARPKSREDEKEPSDKDVDKNVLAVLQGQKRAKFGVNEHGDLLSLAKFAQTHDFRPVIEGCIEGWTVASELGRAGATAIVTPRDRRSPDEDLNRPSGSTIENAAILHEHGVQVAIIPSDTSMNMGGIMGRDLLHLPIEVGFAIRGGLSEEAALEAITVVPARLLGISHRVGTLEEGKDCDLIVTDGDLLHYETFVQYTVVAGKLVYDKAEELFFAHIRPRETPEEVLDPGEEVVEETDEAAEDEGSEDDDSEADEAGDDDADEDSADDEESDEDDEDDDEG